MTTLGTASDGKTGGSVRVSGQRQDGARGALLAPEPKSAAAGLTLTDPVNYTRPWHSQGIASDPERSPVGRRRQSCLLPT